jgi:hypothetical protein
MAQVVEHWSNKFKALSSNPITLEKTCQMNECENMEIIASNNIIYFNNKLVILWKRDRYPLISSSFFYSTQCLTIFYLIHLYIIFILCLS